MNKDVLGIDCGNVILSQMNGTPVAGVLDALAGIVTSKRFETTRGIDIWVVSKCGQRVQDLSLGWLKAINFWEYTGIPESNIRFCRDYQGKAPICEDLGITHFVDDKPEVLAHLQKVPHLFAFNPKVPALLKYQHLVEHWTLVKNWPELAALLLKPTSHLQS